MKIEEYIEYVKNNQPKLVDLSVYELKIIPDEIFEFKWIEKLVIGKYLNYYEDKFEGERFCKLETLSSDLSKLKNLKSLSISGSFLGIPKTPIKDFSVLSELTNIESLYMSATKIKDLSFIKHLPKLKHLQIAHTEIEDFDPISSANQLISLYIGDNKIDNLNFLPKQPIIEALSITTNKITDISQLQNLSKLKRLCLCKNPIDDFAHISPLKNLEHYCNGWHHEFEIISKNINLKELDFEKLNQEQLTQLQMFKKIDRLFIRKFEGDKLNLTNINAREIYVYGTYNSVEGFESLHRLETLSLSSIKLANLSIPELPKLKSISIPETQIDSLDFYDNWETITELDIGWTKIKDISRLQNSSNLNKLYFGETDITDISVIKDRIDDDFRLHFSIDKMSTEFVELYEKYENKGIRMYYEKNDR